MTADPIATIRERLAELRCPGAPTRTIIRKAAEVTGIDEAALLGPSRKAGLCWVRFAIMVAAREQSTLTAIGRTMGRDHTTIVHGLERGRYLLERDRAFADLVALLRPT